MLIQSTLEFNYVHMLPTMCIIQALGRYNGKAMFEMYEYDCPFRTLPRQCIQCLGIVLEYMLFFIFGLNREVNHNRAIVWLCKPCSSHDRNT